MRIVLSAAYGMGNLGDEAICDTALTDIFTVQPHAHVTVLAWSVSRWKKSHPQWLLQKNVRVRPAFLIASQWKSPVVMFEVLLSALAIIRCDIFLWGGGGLIRNREYWLRAYLRSFRLAQFFGRKTLVFAVGVDVITSPRVQALVNTLCHAHALSVRDSISANNLTAAFTVAHPPIEVVGDGVFHFPSQKRQKAPSPVIGINLCNVDGSRHLDPGFLSFLDRFAKVIESLCSSSGCSLLFLPTDQRDSIFTSEVLGRLPSTILSEEQMFAEPKSFLDAASTCSLFIGMRMHAIILASRVQGLPIFGFSYSQKIQLLSQDVHRSQVFSPMDFSVEVVTNVLEQFLLGKKAPVSFVDLEKLSLVQRDFLVSKFKRQSERRMILS